jgi:hypothetical protein
VFLGLITDRSQSDVMRRNDLAAKGWGHMTAAERVEWIGDPYEVARRGSYSPPINLASNVVAHTQFATPLWRNGSVTITATSAGMGQAVALLIGDAADYEGREITLSIDSINTVGGSPRVDLCWYDDEEGNDLAATPLQSAGTVTYTLGENKQGRKYLSLWLYVSTDASVDVGALVQYNGLMLELGSVRHPYVPYTPIVPTAATKGAYNYSDLNRIEMALDELSEWFGSDLVSKTNWGIWDVPTSTDFDRIWHNLTSIASRCRMENKLEGIPPDFRKLTFVHANQIEQFLQDVSEEVTR